MLVLDDAASAVPLARALLAGGIDCMELTLRTPAALEALARILREVPEMLAGVGAVLTPEQVREVKSAGAAFAVAPGMNQAVVRAVADHRRPERADLVHRHETSLEKPGGQERQGPAQAVARDPQRAIT